MTKPSAELAVLADARAGLERARTLDEVMAIRDVAVAALRFAEARKLGEDSVAFAQEIVNRATRRMGEMLAADPRVGSGKGSTLEPLGIKKGQSHRSQQLAKIPEIVGFTIRNLRQRGQRLEPVTPDEWLTHLMIIHREHHHECKRATEWRVDGERLLAVKNGHPLHDITLFDVLRFAEDGAA